MSVTNSKGESLFPFGGSPIADQIKHADQPRKLYRVWIDGEDFGTMSERAAKMIEAHQRRAYPEEPIRLERVADDAPDFLPRPALAAEPSD